MHPQPSHSSSGNTAAKVISAACQQASLTISQANGGVDDAAYRRLTEVGLNENQIKLIERFPANEADFVAAALERLRHAGLIETTSYSTEAFEAYRERVAIAFDHADRVTYIFPEEERLLYALAAVTKPRRVAFLGSYYGYWAMWALPAIAAAGGKATLLDTDGECVSLARRNIERLGLGDTAEVVAGDALAYMRENREQFDWVVLDAEGPKLGLPYDQTDKALYYPMGAVAVERIRAGGMLICHNILLAHHTEDPYFANMIRNNERQFYKFLPFLAASCPRRVELSSTEGVGVYRR